MSTVIQQLASLLLFWTCPHRIRGRVGVVSSFGVFTSVPRRLWFRYWDARMDVGVTFAAVNFPYFFIFAFMRARPLRYGRRPGQPWSSALARRVRVHSSYFFVFSFLSSTCSSRTIQTRGSAYSYGSSFFLWLLFYSFGAVRGDRRLDF